MLEIKDGKNTSYIKPTIPTYIFAGVPLALLAVIYEVLVEEDLVLVGDLLSHITRC